MKSIKVEYTLSNGEKVNAIENGHSENQTAQDIFDETVGYNSGMVWSYTDKDEELTVQDILFVEEIIFSEYSLIADTSILKQIYNLNWIEGNEGIKGYTETNNMLSNLMSNLYSYNISVDESIIEISKIISINQNITLNIKTYNIFLDFISTWSGEGEEVVKEKLKKLFQFKEL